MPDKIDSWSPWLVITGVCFLFLVSLAGCDPADNPSPALTENEHGEPIEVRSMEELGRYYDAIGFNVNTNPDVFNAVPRLRFTHVPRYWEEEPSIPLKQSVFFRTMTTMALEVNEEILKQRQRLLDLDTDSPLPAKEREWLGKMMAKYRVSRHEGPYSHQQLVELALRVDIIPPSLTLVQAAIESAWGSSRFAREANALFGQWTDNGQGIKAQKSDVWLASFTTPHESVAAYCLNLNTHPSYAIFRVKRAELREEGGRLNGSELAMFLEKYSAKGVEYTSLVESMIEQHGLEIADTARLADGPEVVIKPIDGPTPKETAPVDESTPEPQDQAKVSSRTARHPGTQPFPESSYNGSGSRSLTF